MSQRTFATWNVNSIRARIDGVTRWLDQARPDFALLQELKCTEDQMPGMEIMAAGYDLHMVGQKTWNGVAILARKGLSLTIRQRGLPGDDTDEQARYIEAESGDVIFASLYLPNGNPAPGPKFDYKLNWMSRLRRHAATLLATERPVILGGDYNLIADDRDVWDPAAMQGDALVHPESRAQWRALLHLGYTDALRALDSRDHQFTYWDYKAARFQRDEGLRIDHFLLSPEAADRMTTCQIDRQPRGEDKASDHTPVLLKVTR